MADTSVAQTTASTTTASASAGVPSALAGVIQFAPFIVIMVLFYFLMIYPQNKERKKREELLNAIQRGDKVLTRGGIYGVVADIKEQIITLKVSENTKVEIERSFIETVVKG
jgi:preprotein translocase subunit YajC